MPIEDSEVVLSAGIAEAACFAEEAGRFFEVLGYAITLHVADGTIVGVDGLFASGEFFR